MTMRVGSGEYCPHFLEVSEHEKLRGQKGPIRHMSWEFNKRYLTDTGWHSDVTRVPDSVIRELRWEDPIKHTWHPQSAALFIQGQRDIDREPKAPEYRAY